MDKKQVIDVLKQEKTFCQKELDKYLASVMDKERIVREINNRNITTLWQITQSELNGLIFDFEDVTNSKELDALYKKVQPIMDLYNTLMNVIQPGINPISLPPFITEIDDDTEVEEDDDKTDVDEDETDIDEDVKPVRRPVPMTAVVLGEDSTPKSERKRKAQTALPDYAGEPDDRWTVADLREYLSSKSVKHTGLNKHELLRKAQLTYKDRK